MAGIDAVTLDRLRRALSVLARQATIAGVYLFGSRVEGTHDRWSDVDLAVFVEGAETWDMHRRAEVSAMIQAEAGDDIEPHIFPAKSLLQPEAASFPAYIIAHGEPVALN